MLSSHINLQEKERHHKLTHGSDSMLVQSLKGLSFSHMGLVSPPELSNELVIHIYPYFYTAAFISAHSYCSLLCIRLTICMHLIWHLWFWKSNMSFKITAEKSYPDGSFCAVYNRLAMRDSILSRAMSINSKASCVSWRVSSVTANVKWTGEVKGTRSRNSSIWKLNHLLKWNEIVCQGWGKLGAWHSSWLFPKCNGQCGLQRDCNWSVKDMISCVQFKRNCTSHTKHNF